VDAIEENLQSELEECGVLQDTLLGLSFRGGIISEVVHIFPHFLKFHKPDVLKYLSNWVLI
jgi:hypothetical protein